MLQHVIDCCQQLNIETICGAADVANLASNKVLLNIGLHYVDQFPYEGEMINWYELKK